MVRQAAGKPEYSFGGCIIGDEFRSAFPADFDTREQIGLGAGKTVETSRFELQLTKNLDVRGKGYQGAAPVGPSADISIGRANVCTPVTTAHIVCRIPLKKK